MTASRWPNIRSKSSAATMWRSRLPSQSSGCQPSTALDRRRHPHDDGVGIGLVHHVGRVVGEQVVATIRLDGPRCLLVTLGAVAPGEHQVPIGTHRPQVEATEGTIGILHREREVGPDLVDTGLDHAHVRVEHPARKVTGESFEQPLAHQFVVRDAVVLAGGPVGLDPREVDDATVDVGDRGQHHAGIGQGVERGRARRSGDPRRFAPLPTRPHHPPPSL